MATIRLRMAESKAERTLTRVRVPAAKRKWSWRESNPRPHEETMCFLHAYLSLRFRDAARPEPPTAPLSPKTSSRQRSQPQLFPIFLRRLFLRFGTTSLGRRLVPLPCSGIKLVIYCTSIKQREHTRCCQLIFRQKRLRSLPSPSSACLHTISSRRQIQSTPEVLERDVSGNAVQR